MACTKHVHNDKRLSELEKGDPICLTGQRTAVVRSVENVNGLLRITYHQKGMTKRWLAVSDGVVKVHA